MNIRVGFLVPLLMVAAFFRETGAMAEELGYIEEVLGVWQVKYPGPDGMIEEDHVEGLELRRNGAYFWNPPPAWALTTGKWGVVKTREGWLRLCFEEKATTGLRCNYPVLMQLEKGAPSS